MWLSWCQHSQLDCGIVYVVFVLAVRDTAEGSRFGDCILFSIDQREKDDDRPKGARINYLCGLPTVVGILREQSIRSRNHYRTQGKGIRWLYSNERISISRIIAIPKDGA